MEQDHANFIEEYAEMTQAFMTDQEAQWNKWFKEKQTELSGDIAGKLQLQIDDVKEKVYNIAFKVYIISTLEQITSPVTVKLTNKTTGTMQTVTVTKSQWAFMSRKPENTPWKRIWKALWLHRKPLRLQTIIL